MEIDYFRMGYQQNYTFMKMPKILFSGEKFKGLSTNAKVLYMLMLDRARVSEKNGWADKSGRVYIIYTIQEIMKITGWKKHTTLKVLDELDDKKGIGLISREKGSIFESNIYYLKVFLSQESTQS